MLGATRGFFAAKGVMEVDCPALSPLASVDPYIDLIPALLNGHERLFLHSSPEYGMKRLVSQGMGDIYQLSHVFRDNESSERHRHEFTMIEWYRLGFTLQAMAEETCELIRLFVGQRASVTMSYREAFQRFAGVDPFVASVEEIRFALSRWGVEGLSDAILADPEALLDLTLSYLVQPSLDPEKLTIITHFPANQAALARTVDLQGEVVAERFEVYCRGLELANGYRELTDPQEQERRFNVANAARLKRGAESLPMDTSLIEALREGLPDCSGVAVGFDRLMMIRHSVGEIGLVIH